MSVSAVRALSLEALFIGAYFVLREFVQVSGHIPQWLAWGFVAVVLLDLWAVWFKLRAVRYELQTDDRILPAHIVIMCLVSAVRIAIFGLMAVMAYESIVGVSIGEPNFTYLVLALMGKEGLVLYVLGSKRAASRPRAKPWSAVLYLADAVLVLSAEFVLLTLDELFRAPFLDLSWNPIFFVVMVVLSAALFLLFVLSFRVLYSFESLRGSDSALVYEVGSVLFLTVSMLWFSIYSSASTHEEFLEALTANGDEPEFVYERPARIKGQVLKKLCERDSLRNLRLRCDHVGYLPPCVYALPKLEVLDLRDNRLEDADLHHSSSLRRVDLSGNQLRALARIGLHDAEHPARVEHLDLSYNAIGAVDDRIRFAPELVWLDLSYNPLSSFEVPSGALTKLKTLRLQGTLLHEDARRELQARLPHAQIEF